MAIEDEHSDVLQNLEFAISSVHKDDPALLDWDVIEALDALVRGYGLEEQARAWPTVRLSARASAVAAACKDICEWRLGRRSSVLASFPDAHARPPEISVGTLLECLKRLRKSARLWNKRNGRQGYLDFVHEFLP